MQHRAFSAAVFLAAAFSIVPLALAQTQTWTTELGMTIKRIPTVVPSPDGTKVAFVVSEAVMEGEKSDWLAHIHVANADGSKSTQLTRGDKSSTLPRWSPDGKSIGFISSRSGTANVWRIDVSGGEAEQITNEKGGVTLFDWAPDGASIAFVMPEPKSEQEEKDAKEKRDWRTIDQNLKQRGLYVQPVDREGGRLRSSRRLTPAQYSVSEFDWAPDGKTIVFSHQPTPSITDWPRTDISIVSIEDGGIRILAGTAASERTPHFSPDGTRVAFVVSDDPPRWASTDTVSVVAASGGAPRVLANTRDQQPVILGWTGEGARVVVSEVNRTIPTVYTLPADGRAPIAITTTNTHMATPALNATATHLGFVCQDFDKAPEAYVARLSSSFAAVQVSHVQPRLTAGIARSEVLTWKAADGQSIDGILTYPVSHQKPARAPLLVIIHGGPTGVFTNTFIGITSPYPVAAFASSGYAVLRVNPRGSSGYGAIFRYANVNDWGGGDYRDIMAGIDHVIGLGIADPERLGVMGWSYGGYLTSSIVTQTNRFRAASAGAAVTNLISFTGTSDIPDFLPDYFKGEFWTTFDSWRAHSPVLNVSTVRTPTLIQHGEADVRVPSSQGYEFYNALKRRGVTAKMTVYPRQGHAFTEPKMTLDAAKANLEWFDRFVKGTVTVTSAK